MTPQETVRSEESVAFLLADCRQFADEQGLAGNFGISERIDDLIGQIESDAKKIKSLRTELEAVQKRFAELNALYLDNSLEEFHLKSIGLWETYYPFGCDIVVHLGQDLLQARAENARLRECLERRQQAETLAGQ